jgi:hypothetical protein
MTSQRRSARLACTLMIGLAGLVSPGPAQAAAAPTLQVSATSVVSGRTVTFSGRLPGVKRPAQLQVRRDDTWATVMSTTTSSTGRFTFRRTVSGSAGRVLKFRVRGPRATVSGHTYAAVVTPSVKVRIVALSLTTSTTSLGLVEGVSDAFTLELSSKPASPTTVTLSSPDAGAVTVLPATMTFPTASWNVEQDATVAGVQDDDCANESVVVGLTSPGVSQVGVTVTVTDDDPCIAFAEDFSDNSAGWTLGPEWQIGSATPSTGQQQGGPDPAEDHTSTVDNGVAGAVIGGNPTNAIHGPFALTSPVIDVSGLTTVHLEYWRWLNSDYPPFTTWAVEVFNGTSWVSLDTNVGDGNVLTTASSWTKYSFDVSLYVNANFKVRFTHAAGQQEAFLGWIMSGWNVDDVVVSGT